MQPFAVIADYSIITIGGLPNEEINRFTRIAIFTHIL